MVGCAGWSSWNHKVWYSQDEGQCSYACLFWKDNWSFVWCCHSRAHRQHWRCQWMYYHGHPDAYRHRPFQDPTEVSFLHLVSVWKLVKTNWREQFLILSCLCRVERLPKLTYGPVPLLSWAYLSAEWKVVCVLNNDIFSCGNNSLSTCQLCTVFNAAHP